MGTTSAGPAEVTLESEQLMPSNPMSDPAHDIQDLVAAIYDCAIDRTKWAKTLDRICIALAVADVSICMVALDGSEVRYLRPSAFDEVATGYSSDEMVETARFLRRMAATSAVDIDEPVSLYCGPPAEPNETSPATMPSSLTVIMQVSEHRVISVIVTVPYRVPAAGDGLQLRLKYLMPHLRQALRICELIDDQRFAQRSLRASLDLVAPAVLIVDEHCRVLEANATATLLIGQRRGIRLSDGRVGPSDPALEDRFARAVANACGSPRDGAALNLSEDASDAVVAHIVALAPDLITPKGGGRRTVVAIFIGGTAITAPAVLDAVATAYRLTDGEMRVLTQVANGESVAEAAAQLGITLATTRTHLKRIFAKLGVTRHAELVGLLNRIAPLRRPGGRSIPCASER